ncbi:hypothetical protein HYW59_04495 [Candidatus Kaiserbacteria bacterium]|nr:hypothetical protein [Candidatus Kaiserbacteria bacterium]
MKPLSPRKRRLYVWLFVLLFFISVPLALLYAGGYRYKPGYGIVETGGIFISVPYSDAMVLLDGDAVGRSGILNKNFYMDDLAPAAYELQVTRASSTSWHRTVVVEPRIVTEARVVLLPEEIEPIRLARSTSTPPIRSVPPQRYDSYLRAFSIAATTTAESGELEAFVRAGDVYVSWVHPEKKSPDSFCKRPSSCVGEFVVERGSQTTVSVALFDGGIVYATREGGVFFSEMDIRPTPVVVVLYPKARADARVVNGALIIKDGSVLYQIEGF